MALPDLWRWGTLVHPGRNVSTRVTVTGAVEGEVVEGIIGAVGRRSGKGSTSVQKHHLDPPKSKPSTSNPSGR